MLVGKAPPTIVLPLKSHSGVRFFSLISSGVPRLRWAPSCTAMSKRARDESTSSGSKKKPRSFPLDAVPEGEERPVIFRFANTRAGKFLKRYKRFLADVALDEEFDGKREATAHCPNTGPMTGLLDLPKARTILSTSDNPKRKCKFTLELIEVRNSSSGEDVLVGVHSANANNIVKTILQKKLVPAFAGYESVKSEVVFGKDRKSRVDFVLSGGVDQEMYIEVKSVTLAEPYRGSQDHATIGLFPDTVSTRAQKHVKELTEVVEKGVGAAAFVFLIQRRDCTVFAPSFENDPEYSKLLVAAADAGVKIVALCVDFVPNGDGWNVIFLRSVDVDMGYKVQAKAFYGWMDRIEWHKRMVITTKRATQRLLFRSQMSAFHAWTEAVDAARLEREFQSKEEVIAHNQELHRENDRLRRDNERFVRLIDSGEWGRGRVSELSQAGEILRSERDALMELVKSLRREYEAVERAKQAQEGELRSLKEKLVLGGASTAAGRNKMLVRGASSFNALVRAMKQDLIEKGTGKTDPKLMYEVERMSLDKVHVFPDGELKVQAVTSGNNPATLDNVPARPRNWGARSRRHGRKDLGAPEGPDETGKPE